MSQRAGQKEQRHQGIVRSAAALLRERGVAGTTVQAAMGGVGLTIGAFYAHFDDKDDLVREAFQLALDEAASLVEGSAAGLDGLAALRAVVANYLGEGHRDDVRSGCPLPATFGEASTEGPSLAGELLAGGMEVMGRRMAAVAPDVVDEERARELVAVMVGGQVLARATRDTPMSSLVLASCRDVCERILDGCERGQDRTTTTKEPA